MVSSLSEVMQRSPGLSKSMERTCGACVPSFPSSRLNSLVGRNEDITSLTRLVLGTLPSVRVMDNEGVAATEGGSSMSMALEAIII